MPIADQKHICENALHVVGWRISAESDAVTNTAQTAGQGWKDVLAMDVREKLVELIKEGIRKGLRARGDDRLDYSFEDVADYLISNGVTVQEWISVNDRLPETGGYVVCIAKRNPFSRFMPMVARIEKNGWVNPMTEQYISEVTRWMPLPDKPKGGNMQ